MLRPDTLALTALLALLTAVGPLSVDMYLPSLPDIGRELAARPARVQLTISFYLVGFALGQIVYGPLSDRYGRKPVLLAALGLFSAAGLACALASSIHGLIVARFFQACGGAGAVVLARALTMISLKPSSAPSSSDGRTCCCNGKILPAMALSYLFLVDIEPHQQEGQGPVQGISEKYHGSTDTRLEAALKGAMADKLAHEERSQIFQWIRAGATAEDYPKIKPVLEQKCAPCHSAQSGMPIAPLTSFEDVKKVATPDTGVSMLSLARVSHIHLFGISIIFLLTGAIFSLSMTPIWFRVAVLVIPYLAIIMDIGSWWATKYYDPIFAYIVLIGGAFMGLAMACQILVSLWDMWIAPLTATGRAKSKELQSMMPLR